MLGLLDVSRRGAYWHVLVLAAASGSINAVDTPDPAVIRRRDGRARRARPTLVAINSTIFNIGRVIGPAVAGVMISAVGTGWAFIGNAASSAAVLVGLAMMRHGRTAPVAADRPRPRPAPRGLPLRPPAAAT